MSFRAVLYARRSTDNQSEASVPDQLKACRLLAERLGAHVVREFSDEVSGQAKGNRPGVRALLDFARRRQCDIVIAEHTDRLARKGELGFGIFEDFKAWGVRYFTVMEDRVTVLKQAVSVLVSEHKLEETSIRTVRGLAGRVEAGRSGGGLSYGYRVKRLYDDAGEPVRGFLEIDVDRAAVVVRIFRDYAAGVSPISISSALNAEGLSAPRGGLWNASTIAGNARRGHGIVHNELYRGVRLWGRQTFSKDRHTGARKGRPVEADERPILRVEVPELRIVDDALWAAAQARWAQVSTVSAETGRGRRGPTNRPKRFLQGLLVCGLCGGAMHKAGPRDALRCSTRIAKGACANTKTPGYDGLEARVFAAIKANLLHPEVIEHAMRKVHEGLRESRRQEARGRARLEGDLAEVKRRMARLIDQVEDGAPWAAVASRHGELEARRDQLAAEISAGSASDVVVPHPASPALYRKKVAQLQAALDNAQDADDHEGREAVRALIHQVRVTPAEGHGRYELEIVGDLAPLLLAGQSANEKGPLAGASVVSALDSMSELGAGTRFTRRHTPLAEVRLRA